MPIPKRKPKPEKHPEQLSDAAYFLIQWRGHGAVGIPCPSETLKTIPSKLLEEQKSIPERFRAIAENLCEKYQGISIDSNVLGGMPHLKGLRISVPHILTHLHHLGSVDAIVAEFKQRISKEQVKEAIAYSHDFMEIACDPFEDDD